MSAQIQWLASYPKSGNTWMRLILSYVRGEDDEPTSINNIGGGTIASSRTWLEECQGFATGDLTDIEIERFRPAAYRWAAQRAERSELHKIHDACTRNDQGEWIPCPEASGPSLYLIRNPLDVAISYAAHTGRTIDHTIALMQSEQHQMARQGKTGILVQVPQRILSWSGHVMSWADNPAFAIKVIRYEDMLADPLNTMVGVLDHLGIDCSEAVLAQAIDNTRFSLLREQEDREPFKEKSLAAERFFRKGIAGDWRESLTAAQIEQIVADHRQVMQRFGYCDANGVPKVM